MHLYAAAIREAEITHQGELTIVDFRDAHGAITVTTADFCQARRIAESDYASLIRARDVGEFTDLFATRVSRPGAKISTSGKVENLLQIAKLMQCAGMDYGSWHFPRVIRQVMRQRGAEQPPVARPTNELNGVRQSISG